MRRGFANWKRENKLMAEDTSQNNGSWFSGLDWKTAIIIACLGSVFGVGGGAGVIASKGVQAAGLDQNQADLRYLRIDEADKRSIKRDAQIDRIEAKIDDVMKKLDEKYVRKDIYDRDAAATSLMLKQILENQKAGRGE